MKFYSLKSCDTCRKALKSLAAAGIAPDVIDLRAEGIAPADLASIIATFGDSAINRTSTTWRALPDDQRGLDPAALIAAHPTLLKRPAIQTDQGWTLGWKPDVQARYLA